MYIFFCSDLHLVDYRALFNISQRFRQTKVQLAIISLLFLPLLPIFDTWRFTMATSRLSPSAHPFALLPSLSPSLSHQFSLYPFYRIIVRFYATHLFFLPYSKNKSDQTTFYIALALACVPSFSFSRRQLTLPFAAPSRAPTP